MKRAKKEKQILLPVLLEAQQEEVLVEQVLQRLLKKEDFCKYFFDFIENIMIYSSIAALPPVTVYM